MVQIYTLNIPMLSFRMVIIIIIINIIIIIIINIIIF